MSIFANVEYIQNKDYPTCGSIYLNGIKLNRVTGIEFEASVDEIPEVTLHLASTFRYDGLARINIDLPIETLEQAFDCLRLYTRNNYYGVHDRLMDSIKAALDSSLDGDELAEHILHTMLEETELEDVFADTDSGHEYA